MASLNSTQEICVDVVKYEVSSDNGNEPVVLSEVNDYASIDESSSIVSQVTASGTHQFSDNGDHISPSSGNSATTGISSLGGGSIQDSNTTNAKTTPPSSELIRLFGPSTSAPVDIDGNPILPAGSLASQFCPLGPKERCTPSQAQAMGEQILGLIAMHKTNGAPLPFELQNTFDIFHRCLAVAYGTFFLNLYTKANAPSVLCHGCKSLYPPGQYIHHSCLALPPNIVPCRSRMWRRCLVPLMSQDMNKTEQKERWKFVLEKFSHASMAVGKRNVNHVSNEPQLLEMPECKRGKFISDPSSSSGISRSSGKSSSRASSKPSEGSFSNSHNNVPISTGPTKPIDSTTTSNRGNGSISPTLLVEDNATNNTTIIYNCISDDEQTTGDTSSFIAERDAPFTMDSANNTRVMGILKELVREVDKLERDLTETKDKLSQTEKRLKMITSGDSLSEQFVQSLLAQEKLTVEKKELIRRLQIEEEKSSKLEKQLNKIEVLHLEIQNQLKS